MARMFWLLALTFEDDSSIDAPYYKHQEERHQEERKTQRGEVNFPERSTSKEIHPVPVFSADKVSELQKDRSDPILLRD